MPRDISRVQLLFQSENQDNQMSLHRLTPLPLPRTSILLGWDHSFGLMRLRSFVSLAKGEKAESR
jgi:hypothetical protein